MILMLSSLDLSKSFSTNPVKLIERRRHGLRSEQHQRRQGPTGAFRLTITKSPST